MNEKKFRNAAAHNDLKEINDLFLMGVNINAKGPDSGRTALHWAALNGYMQTIVFLIEKKAHLDLVDNDSNTALHLLIQNEDIPLHNRLAIAKALLTAGANPLIENRQEETFLMLLAKLRNKVVSENLTNSIAQVRETIRQVKQIVFEMAKTKGLSAAIQSSGKVVFGATEDLMMDPNNYNTKGSGVTNIISSDLNTIPYHP